MKRVMPCIFQNMKLESVNEGSLVVVASAAKHLVFHPQSAFLAGGHGVEPLFPTQAQTRMDTGFVPAPVNTGSPHF